jgi:tetratricopeptide (TPR) repeat protein
LREKVLAVALVSIALLIAGCADKNVTQGKILLKQKPPEYEKAIEQFNLALQTNPKNADAWFLKGKAYAEIEKYEEMNEAFGKAMQYKPEYETEIEQIREDKYNRVFNKGLRATEDNDFNSALEHFETCIVIDPSSAEAYANAGFCASKLEIDKKALEYYKKAYELDPDNFDNIRNYGAVLYKMEMYDEAIEVYKAAQKVRPDDTNIPIRIGQIYEKLGDLDKALESYQHALEIEEDNPNLWFNLGVMYLQKKEDPASAEKAFAEAYKLNPDDIDAAFNLVISQVRQQKYKEAAVIVQELEKKAPGNCDVYELMASVYAGLGDKKMVNEAVKKRRECEE